MNATQYPVGTSVKVINETTHKISYIAETDGENWNTY